MQKLTRADAKTFLQAGELTKPFLDKDYVLDKVMCDYNRKISLGESVTKIDSLMSWINHCVTTASDSNFLQKHKFNRTAEEIWESKVVTGCTDRAMLFCTFARQIEIPTTLLHTVKYNYLKDFLSGKDVQIHKGHTFCECFYDGKWILVDPTCRKIVYDYNPDRLVLPYNNLNSNVFVPYFRGLDLTRKMTLKQHNKQEEEACKKLQIEILPN